MKIPSFVKTIRFKLAMWYSVFFVLLVLLLVIGLNAAMARPQPEENGRPPPFLGDSQTWRQAVEDQQLKYQNELRLFSLIGAGAILVMGAVGGYLLSRAMLQPVDRISALAERISYTNLKERIKHTGPNDELKRLADTFDNMLQRLDSAFDSQKRFVQDASHELRTPIAIAQTNIEVLEMEPAATIKDYQETIRVLKLSLERMNNVSNSLLLLSENASTRPSWQQVDFATLVNEVLTETRAEAKAAGIDLEFITPSGEVIIRGDAFRLKQAVVNLVDNAIKYNLPGGAVTISVSHGDGSWVIEVRDTGIGIAPVDQQLIFERFYRVDTSRCREKGGFGLGLAIVKKIVEDHGGKIIVESNLGQGSIFRIFIPDVEQAELCL
jgi:signal transduction histidine kinase